MSKLYDDALVEKLKYWTADAQIEVYGPNETTRLFEVMADKNDDKPIELPILCLSRDRGFTINETTKRPLTYDGKTIEADYETSLMLNAIPITLSYQLDIYTRYAEQMDILLNNLVFNLINYPSFTITIPNTDKEHTANLIIDGVVEDNSNIPERFIVGNFIRTTIRFVVKDAYLWNAQERHNVTIDLRIDDSI